MLQDSTIYRNLGSAKYITDCRVRKVKDPTFTFLLYDMLLSPRNISQPQELQVIFVAYIVLLPTVLRHSKLWLMCLLFSRGTFIVECAKFVIINAKRNYKI